MGCCFSVANRRNSDDTPVGIWKPFQKRSCTDVIPLLVFILFFVGMILIAAFSVVNGAAARLINGFDSYGNICDRKNKKLSNSEKSGLDLTGKKFVFFMDPRDPYHSLDICVKECPNRYLHSMKEIYEFYKETNSSLCDYDLDPELYLTDPQARSSLVGPCPIITVNSSIPLFYRCIPTEVASFVSFAIQFVSNLDPLSMVLTDIYQCRYAIISLCFLSLLVSFIIVLLVRYLANIVVYIINIVVAITSLVGTGLLWWMYAAASQNIELKPFNVTLVTEETNATTLLAYSITATVLTVILLLLIIVMRKRVSLAIDLFHEAGRCIMKIPFLLLQPIWGFFILLLFWLGWLSVFAFLATSGDPVLEDPHTGWIRFNSTALIRYMWWYHVIGLVWVSEFILACQQMVIAGAVAKYYFTRDKDSLGDPIMSSMSRLIANHLGSCALGSFIITLVKIPRCILMYIERQLKDSENIIAKIMLKCCICCLCILEKCLRYLNYNAYSLVAVNGTNFCKSACDAVATLVSNPLRVLAINSVGTFVLFLGKLLVVAIVAGICGIFVLKYHPNVHFVAAPIGVVAVFSYLSAHCFLTVYEMVIDTLLLCFCEDSRVNDGTPGREYFMHKSLLVYVKNSSKMLDSIEGKKKKTEKTEESERLHSTSGV